MMKPTLDTTRIDVAAALARGIAGACPFVGGLIAEAVNHLIPNQKLDRVIGGFTDRPSWVAIVNIKALSTAVTSIQDQFLRLKVRPVSELLGINRNRVGRRRTKKATA